MPSPAIPSVSQSGGQRKAAPPANDPLTSPAFDPAAISQTLRSGDSLTISYKDGEYRATKSGPSAYNNWFQGAAGAGSAVVSAAFNTLDSAIGTDPTLTALTGFQTMFTTFSNMPLIANGITMFSDKFMPGFRLFAPILDAMKLANTVKTSTAKVKIAATKAAKESAAAIAKGLAPPPAAPTGLWAHIKAGDLIGIGIDAAHLGLNLVCAASILGAMINLPAIVLMAPAVAIGVGLAGDICAAVYHTAGTGMNINDPRNGASYSDRFSRFVRTQAGSAMFRRVFRGQEPLLAEGPEVDPTKGPIQDPAGDTGARPPATAPPDNNNGKPTGDQPEQPTVPQ